MVIIQQEQLQRTSEGPLLPSDTLVVQQRMCGLRLTPFSHILCSMLEVIRVRPPWTAITPMPQGVKVLLATGNVSRRQGTRQLLYQRSTNHHACSNKLRYDAMQHRIRRIVHDGECKQWDLRSSHLAGLPRPSMHPLLLITLLTHGSHGPCLVSVR